MNNNIVFLKNFYCEVWCKLDKMTIADKILYKIFNSELDKNPHINLTRIATLSILYSVPVDNISCMERVIDECMNEHECDNKNCMKILEYDCFFKKYTNQGNNKLQSFISKYCHCYSEVNNRQATPIIDKYIKLALQCKNYNDVKEKIKLIIKNLETEDNQRIDLDNCISLGDNILYQNISIYRLIDKYLWTYQKFKNNTEIPNKILKLKDSEKKYFDEKTFNEITQIS
jgi:hypothetical protein